MLSRLRKSRFAFPLAALAALAMFVISETSYQQASKAHAALGRQIAARVAIQTLWRGLVDAETGERGYLLTGRNEYREPYTSALAQVGQTTETLKRYYAGEGDPANIELMMQLGQAAGNKLSELAETIKLYDAGKDDTWRNVLMSNIGEEQMSSVRRLSERLLDIESVKVEAARHRLGETLMLNRIGVTAMTALSLLALYMYLRQTVALGRQREEQSRIVQAERDQLGREVASRTAQLTELARHLQTAREDERQLLARELHDELGALLTGAKLDVARLKSRIGVLSPEVAERLQHLNEGLNSGIALKRRIIEDLRPSSLSNLGLVSALDILVSEWRERTEIAVESTLEPVRLSASGQLTVYRLVQEALTNISKYAQATSVHVTLGSAHGRVRVSVRDDGTGFDVDAPRTSAHGLLGMRYRLETEGGQLSLHSSPGGGTLIEADLPELAEQAGTAPLRGPALAMR